MESAESPSDNTESDSDTAGETADSSEEPPSDTTAPPTEEPTDDGSDDPVVENDEYEVSALSLNGPSSVISSTGSFAADGGCTIT